MLRSMLRAKLHRATVTEASLDYEGSLTVDMDLMDAVGMQPYEEILVANINNGERFTTYLIEGERGSGTICVNGAAARRAGPGDKIIVMAFGLVDEEEAKTHKPRVILLDELNHIVKQS